MGGGLTEQFPQAQNMSDFPAAAHDLLGLDGLLTTEERCTRDAVRQFMVRACPPVQSVYVQMHRRSAWRVPDH